MVDSTELIAALRLARPYVEKVAATRPTENARLGRQQQAVRDLREIDTIIGKTDVPTPRGCIEADHTYQAGPYGICRRCGGGYPRAFLSTAEPSP